jgi:hypothetical protein
LNSSKYRATIAVMSDTLADLSGRWRSAGPTTTYVLQALAWCAAILLVFVPVAVRRNRRTVQSRRCS